MRRRQQSKTKDHKKSRPPVFIYALNSKLIVVFVKHVGKTRIIGVSGDFPTFRQKRLSFFHSRQFRYCLNKTILRAFWKTIFKIRMRSRVLSIIIVLLSYSSPPTLPSTQTTSSTWRIEIVNSACKWRCLVNYCTLGIARPISACPSSVCPPDCQPDPFRRVQNWIIYFLIYNYYNHVQNVHFVNYSTWLF